LGLGLGLGLGIGLGIGVRVGVGLGLARVAGPPWASRGGKKTSAWPGLALGLGVG